MCPSRVSSNVVIVETSTVPSIAGSRRPRSFRRTRCAPLHGDEPELLDLELERRPDGSIDHVPVGMTVAGDSATIDMYMLLCVRYY